MGKKLNKQDKLHESNRYKDMAFPVGMYTVTIDGIEPEGRGYLDLHWHEELQYTGILSGTVNMDLYATGKALEKAGVVSGLDITTESALGKLFHLMGVSPDNNWVKNRLGENLRGEISK